METLKKSLVVILGVLLISSFVTNVNHQPAAKTELSNGEKNIELIKKFIKENEFTDINISFEAISSSQYGIGFHQIKLMKDNLSFEDIYVVVKDEDNTYYFEGEKILYVKTYTDKKGLHLVIKLN